MKSTLQEWFSKHKSKHLDRVLSSKDCCVQRVLTEQQALQSPLLSAQVVRGGKARALMTPVWLELIKECQLRDDVMIIPSAKL